MKFTLLVITFLAVSGLYAQTQPDPRVLLDPAGATAGQVLEYDGTKWNPASTKVDYVADSTAFRAYNRGADVIIMADRNRGGKFRKNPSATADQYMVFTDANSNKWERFDYGDIIKPEWFSAKSIVGNDTRGWKLGLRYAAKVGLKMVLTSSYTVKDSILMDRKFVLEGTNSFNQTATLNWVDFDIPGNVPAITFIPKEQYTQGPIVTNCCFRDISTSGTRHFIEFYAIVEDVKACGYAEFSNIQFRDFDRYAIYVNDCYITTLLLSNLEVPSCGGIIGVDMSEAKLVTQSQGDTWTIENVNLGGNFPDVVGQDTALLDVRDVGNVIISNVVLQGYVSSTCKKNLIWADHGNVEINKLYSELVGPGVLPSFGKFGSLDNPNCSVVINGATMSIGSAYENVSFRLIGPTTVKANDFEFGSSDPSKTFVTVGATKRNVEFNNYIGQGRPLRVDFSSYRDKLSFQGTDSDWLLEYPAGGEILRVSPDTLFGLLGYATSSLYSGGPYTREIDATMGKVHKLVSTGSRLAFTIDLALPPSLRGKIISVSMTYKFTVSDSTASSPRWAISDGLGGEYTEMAQLQLGRWVVATDVFYYPTSTTTTQIVFGDAGNAFPSANATMLIKDIVVRFGRDLLPESMASSTTKNDIIFRSNISGANVAGFNNGDLVSTPLGLYQKQGGVFVKIGSGTINGSGGTDQVAYFSDPATLTSSSNMTYSSGNLVVNSSGDKVQLIPGTSKISLFNSGIVDAQIFASDAGKIETNVGLAVVGNSAITGDLDVSGSITTSSHFRAPGISSGPSGLTNTANGTLQAWAPNGNSPYLTLTEGGAANRGAMGFLAGDADLVWTFGNQVLASGTERMRLKSGGQLKLNAYTSTSAFSITPVGLLGYDASGNIGTNAANIFKTVNTTNSVEASDAIPVVASGLNDVLTLNSNSYYLVLSKYGAGKQINFDFYSTFFEGDFGIKNDVDDTKLLRFDVSGFTTGTTRIATWPNKSGTVAFLDDITGGESTTIGAYQATGTANGLSLSGTDVRLHTATTTTPGGVSVGADAWTGQKESQRTSSSALESFRATNTGTGGAAFGFKSNGVTLGYIYGDESGSQSKIALAPNDAAAEPTDYLTADGNVQKVINGKGWRVAVRSVGGNTTVAASDYYLRLSTSTPATYTFTLPAGAIGDQFVLLNDGSSGVVLSVVGNGSDTVENTTSITIGALGETKTFTKTSSTNWDVK